MLSLQFNTLPHPPLLNPNLNLNSSTNICSFFHHNNNKNNKLRLLRSNVRTLSFRVFAMSGNSAFKMNLNEYLVTLEKPLGIRFALTSDGKIIVHSLTKGGNAEKSRIIMVGDTLKKAGDSSQNSLVEIRDVGDTHLLVSSGRC